MHSPYPFGSTYNASKAAVHAYSDTLRLELQPFNVKVTTVLTGRVKSNLARSKRELPPGSMYVPIEDMYNARVNHGLEDSMPADAYCKSVVSQLLVSEPKGWLWEGKSSWSVWFMSGFMSKQRVVSDLVFP
jgi:1-acylglycerone phosphate reductase